MLMTSGGFFPVVGMLVIHNISSLGLGLTRISKANTITVLVTSCMKCMTAKDAKSTI